MDYRVSVMKDILVLIVEVSNSFLPSAFARCNVTVCKEQKSTTRDEVEWRDCCSLHTVTSSVIYYSTHTRKNVIYLFYTIKKFKWFIEGFLGHEKKTSLLT